MRLINIVDCNDRTCIVNADHVSAIYVNDGSTAVKIALTNGHSIVTKFTDIEHAAEYVHLAGSVPRSPLSN